MGPAAALLMPLLLGSDGSGSKAGHRLLVYLRCCLTGLSFPPGPCLSLLARLPPYSSAPSLTCQHCTAALCVLATTQELLHKYIA